MNLIIHYLHSYSVLLVEPYTVSYYSKIKVNALPLEVNPLSLDYGYYYVIVRIIAIHYYYLSYNFDWDIICMMIFGYH